MTIQLPIEVFREGAVLRVTGQIISESGHPRVQSLLCMAATVYEADNKLADPYEFKVWPMDSNDPQLPAGHDGKLWFDYRRPDTHVEVIEKSDLDCRDFDTQAEVVEESNEDKQ